MTATARSVPDASVEPTITVDRASAVCGVSKRAGYAAVDRGEWPHIRVGRRVVIPTARWLAALGLDGPARTQGAA